jgi:lipopolysaccharide transport system ATP-binding protein
MSDIAIRCSNLGKQYRLGQRESYRALRDTIADTLSAPFRGARRIWAGEPAPAAKDATLWALRDVSFDIKHGEVVGIIGRNGAGKSTLLKILSRITKPTTGEVRINGRVGSLLEVGTGFHPELTGRENIFLNGAILGMKRAEIQRKFDEIVAFAEIEQFLDTPVKRYSSGMFTRLAFAVAAHLEPEILAVDEVLAVGDAQFQKKCLGKMSDVAKKGRTVLFVSHNMVAVQNLCNRALWLETGRLRDDSTAPEIVAGFLQGGGESCLEQSWETPQIAPGNQDVRLRCLRLAGPDGAAIEQISVDNSFRIEIEYWNLKPEARLNLSLLVYSHEGSCVFATTTIQEPEWHGRPFALGLYRSVCTVPANLLNDGVYRVTLLVVQDVANILYNFEDIAMFEVHDTAERVGWYGKWPGAVRPELEWTTALLKTSVSA